MNKKAEILIVEENPEESEHLKRILKLHDYHVSVEHNVEHALETIRERKPEIVISAAESPETNGYELCCAVKADRELADISVILLTSLDDTTDIFRGMECGADNFVSRPLEEKLITSAIENILLKRKQQLRESDEQPEIEVIVDGEKYTITQERELIVDWLISTYETAVQKNLELQEVRDELNALTYQFEERVKGRTGEISREIIEYKAAEASLKEQQKFLRQMIDANPNIIFVKDEEGRFIQANQAMARVYGVSVEDLIGKTAADFIDKEEANLVAEQDREVLTTLQNKFIPEERIINLKTGEVHWLQTVKKPLLSSNGQIRQILCVATDITLRKRAEEERDRFFAISEDLLCTIRFDGYFQYINPAWQQTLGFTEKELLAKPFIEIIHPDDRAFITDEVEKLIAKGVFHSFEIRLLDKDDTVRWFLWSATPFVAEGLLYAVGKDITERKRSEEKLRDSEKYFRALIENTSDIITVLDHNAIIRYESPSIERILGFTQDELVGRSVFELIHPDDLELVKNIFAAGMQTPGIPHFIESRFQHKDGHWCFLEATGINLLNDPAVSGIIINSRDITNRKQSEKALHESELLLRQAQKMEAIGTLTGGVAHDFNNLLTAILGNTQLALSKVAPDDPLQHRLIEIEKAGNRAARLTSQLLAFSRRQHLERRIINLNDNIAEIIKLLQRIIGEDVEMSVRCASNLWSVYADPAQIEQVVMNLAVNARDAMPQGGKLIIETCNIQVDENYARRYPTVQPGKYVQIRVSDSGKGMDEETKAHIFEPYFTTKELGKGTGLGLSMVYGIISQHEGYIDVLSEIGHGTTFEVFLPVVEKMVDEQAQATQLPLFGGMETVLVAEDEEPLRTLAKDILEGLNYTVLLAKNGEEAVEIYEKNRDQVDLLLFDIVMPRMGGVEASERIREMDGNVPRIFMTGYSFENIQTRFIKQNQAIENLEAIIQKPYSLQTLGRKVREVLDANQKPKSKNITG
jgi:two-component system, cell cycle sensor histidine kinase and response regulator CckA